MTTPKALSGAVLATALALQPALAQEGDFPNRPIRLVLPFAAGGGADAVGRLFAQQMSADLGHPVVVENITGAGGMIGTARAARAEPDGYTLLIGTPSTHGTNSAVYTKLSYDPIKDFRPVSLLATSPLMLIAAPGFQGSTVRDLINAAKASPGALAYGSYGLGSINHLAIEMFLSAAGIQANHIPYKGSAPAMTDLISGQIQFTIDGPTALGFIRSGKVKLLGTGSAQRWATFPDTPTIAESGLPGYEALTWFGMFAPAGTPDAVVARLNRAVDQALANEKTRAGLASMGLDPAGGAPKKLGETVEAEIRKWTAIAREKSIRLDP
ncbi:MAG: tripartite tricarboxylate transporter substrate binding protein [Alcaligenaceae bacterium]|nr:tripartite tricarboxylate transporter substrate binding protein [Alcaligenaceae bacterium SAGV5]MPS51330.1 tripartite tricarboxylate transporter substrate binding protein [Alcaligenaceae bacterium SAGV3]MPT55898.1 tripartite tricarboxylate transporter substrate binding protein [Alcaligenaceae bacterium]